MVDNQEYFLKTGEVMDKSVFVGQSIVKQNRVELIEAVTDICDPGIFSSKGRAGSQPARK